MIQSQLISRGPLSIAMNANLLQFYHSGVYDPILPCDSKELNHGMYNNVLLDLDICYGYIT